MAVYFYNEDYFFLPKNKTEIKKWIKIIISQNNCLSGDINYIFTSDEQLHKMNLEYLNHDYLTDIITFDYSKNNTVNGDIFISIERVMENAEAYHVSFGHELKRVIIHGVLHLIGYKDKTEVESQLMRELEDKALTLIDHLVIT